MKQSSEHTMQHTIKNPNNGLLFVALLCAGVVIGYIWSTYTIRTGSNCSLFYKYLNDNLGCRDKPYINKAAYVSFEKNLRAYTDNEKKAGRVIDVGVYFRDLENGPTFGLDSGKLFISASLIKLPTVMTVLRLSEQDPSILDRRIVYTKEIESDNQDFQPDKKLEVGKTYTVDELITRSLQYSDNGANELLIDELTRISPNEDLIYNTFNDLGLNMPEDIAKGDLSTKSYSSLLRLLYNASFLSKENSEKILSILDKAAFKQGLEDAIPQGIRVASKFGEREIEYVTSDGRPQGKINELHDCGIIYYPHNPYMLCVMTKGYDFKTLSRIISHISSMVYEEVDSRAME